MEEIEIYFDEFLQTQVTSYELLSGRLQEDIEKIKQFFDLQQELFYNHLIGIRDPSYKFEEYERIVIQCYLKSNQLIFSAHQLILLGDYGSARVLMRQIFEYLILGKFIQTTKNNSVAKKWLNNSNFDIFDKIINYLKEPDKKNFHEFWRTLCKLAHAGKTSSQITNNNEFTYEEITGTYKMNLLFLCCKNIFLQDCFINSRLKYRSEKYGLKKIENKEIKKQLKRLEKEYLELFSEAGISIIDDYKKNWEFKKVVNK